MHGYRARRELAGGGPQSAGSVVAKMGERGSYGCSGSGRMRPSMSMKHPKVLELRSWLAGALLLCACRAAPEDPAAEAMATVQRWASAFEQSNVDAIVGLYAPDALFFGTGSKALVTTPDGVRSYFATGLNRDKPRGAKLLEHSLQVVSEDVVVVTGIDQVSGTKDGNVYQVQGRVSFVLSKRGGSWLITHFHRSALPG